MGFFCIGLGSGHFPILHGHIVYATTHTAQALAQTPVRGNPEPAQAATDRLYQAGSGWETHYTLESDDRLPQPKTVHTPFNISQILCVTLPPTICNLCYTC